MSDDIDIDCSDVLDGTSLDTMGSRIFDIILETASGRPTASESFGLGESEWVPWVPGAMY
jgi:altronate hydrolase